MTRCMHACLPRVALALSLQRVLVQPRLCVGAPPSITTSSTLRVVTSSPGDNTLKQALLSIVKDTVQREISGGEGGGGAMAALGIAQVLLATGTEASTAANHGCAPRRQGVEERGGRGGGG